MGDFFISYNSADKVIAEQVATAFRDAGYSVRFAGWELGLGDDIDQWMWDAIEECDRCLGIFSPDYLKKDAVFSQAERGTYYWQGMKGMRAAIIPVIARACTMPKVLDAKIYHDLQTESVDALVAKWAEHPLHQRKRAIQLNRQHVARPVRGREADLEDLQRHLRSTGKSTIRNTVVKGGGGIGKTTLARYYIHQCHRDYDGILWCDAESQAGLIDDLYRLYTHLTGNLPPEERHRQGAAALLDMVGQRDEQWLFVYDNLTDYDAIDGLLPPGHLIVTTRDNAGFPGFGEVTPDVLASDGDDAPAVVVLMDAAERTEDGEGARKLSKILEGLPLALVIAGAMIKETGQSFDAYCEKVSQIIQEVPVNSDYPDSVVGAVTLTHNRLKENLPEAAVLAELCAWLAPDGLKEELFAKAVATEKWTKLDRMRVTPKVRALLEDAQALGTALRGLRRWSVVSDKDGMHRLTQAVLRGTGGQAMAESAAALLAAQFPSGKDNPQLVHTWPTCRRLVPHVQALWAAAATLWQGDWGKPGWAAMDYLLGQSGVFLSRQHDLPAAIDAQRGSLALTEARLGEEDRAIPTALGNLALNLADTGAFAEAQDYIDRAVALNEQYRTGAARADLAGSYMQQASLGFRRMQAGGQVAEGAEAMAEAALDKAREIRAELSGEGSAEMSNWWNQMGYLRRLQGRKGAELQASGRALQILRALPQADRGDLATRAMNYGGTALELGRAEEAQAALQEAYDLECAFFDADNPSIITTARWLTACLLVLARKGQNTRAQAEALCAKHGLDFAEMERSAALLPLEPVPLNDEPTNPSD